MSERSGTAALPQLPGITIDSPGAQDLDDAVWAVREGEHIRLWISITDVSRSIPPQSPLMQQALLWLESRYRGDRLVRSMLPPRLTQRHSLLPHELRPVVSLEVLVTASGQCLEQQFQRGILLSQGRLSYECVDLILGGRQASPFAERLQILAQAAAWLDKGRQGVWGHAIDGEFRDDTGQVLVGSRQLIATTAIAYNALVAQVLATADCPALYRVQDISRVEEFAVLIEQMGNRAELLAPLISHRLPRAEHRTAVAPHWALRLPAYTRSTSPLRRVEDLVNQHQLLAVLSGDRPPGSDKAHHPSWAEGLLAGLCERLQDRALALEAIQRERGRTRRQAQLAEATTLIDLTANQLTGLLEQVAVNGEPPDRIEPMIQVWLETDRLTPRHAAVIFNRSFSPSLRQTLLAVLSEGRQTILNAVSILAVLEQIGWGQVRYDYRESPAGWECRAQWQTFEVLLVASSKTAARSQAALKLLEAWNLALEQ